MKLGTALDQRMSLAAGTRPARLRIRHAWFGVVEKLPVPSWCLVLAFYTTAALVTVGQQAVLHPTTVCSCVGTEDPAQYMWALYWWPYALMHGLNPFITHYLWAPSGVNTAQAALIPTAALLLAPITPLIGPVAGYNVLSVGSAISAAFAAYLLCRRLVKREAAAAAGGYLFGFSSYELAQLTGHLNLTLIFPIPLMVLLALQRGEGAISRRRYVILLAITIVVLAGISTELLADSVGLGAVTLCAAWIFACAPATRERIKRMTVETIAAGALSAIVLSPFLYYALFSGGTPAGPPGLSDVYGLDLLNPLFPTYVTRFGRSTFYSLGISFETGNVTEAGGYLSLPIMVAFGLWWIGARRTALARVSLMLVTVALLLALGSHLHVAGYQTMALPFDLVRRLPVFNDILPSRLILFVTLAVAVGIASWLATAHTRTAMWRWALVIVGAAMLFPNLGVPLWRGVPVNPVFFRTPLYKRYLVRGSSVLILPFGVNDVSTLWQAETNFYFSMPEGYISGVVPPPFNASATVAQLVANQAVSAKALRTFILQHHVGDVIIDSSAVGPWPAVLGELGWVPLQVGGVTLYRVPLPSS
jgi:hypothetical protein